jgi:hypothetical protein
LGVERAKDLTRLLRQSTYHKIKVFYFRENQREKVLSVFKPQKKITRIVSRDVETFDVPHIQQ